MSEPKREWMILNLSHKALKFLGRANMQPGTEDLSAAFREAMTNTNWDDVRVMSRRKSYVAFSRQAILLELNLYRRMQGYARSRGFDPDLLCDAVVIHYYLRCPKSPWKRLSLNLTETADSLLRTAVHRKGDISEKFREAAQNTNWEELKIRGFRKREEGIIQTAATIEASLYESLKEHAKKRKVPLSALVEAIIISYYSHRE